MTTQTLPKKNLLKRGLVGCLTTLGIACLGLVVLYYGARWGYYQGRWGKDNPVARYLWLCNAPAGFERTLYPENVEILSPACEGVGSVEFTSDKQYLRVRTTDWVEIATGQITTTRPGYVQYFTGWTREDGERIDYWIDLGSGEVLTTSPGNVVTLAECGLDYDFWEGLFSEDGRRIARYDGIYDAASGERLLQYGIGDYEATGDSYHQSIHDFYPCVWLPDNQSVILIPPMLPWGLELLIWGDYGEYMSHSEHPVPQPVLRFTVPEAYR